MSLLPTDGYQSDGNIIFKNFSCSRCYSTVELDLDAISLNTNYWSAIELIDPSKNASSSQT